MSLNENGPLVSIIVPVYNGEQYIRDTIDSVINQTYPYIECIVVDDGSTDATPEILKAFGNKIFTLTQNNSGQSIALNNGFELAKGDYIGYLSADDLIDLDHVKGLINEFHASSDSESSQFKECVLFSRYRLIDSDGCAFGLASKPFHGQRQYVEKFNNVIGPGAIFSRSLFTKNGGWDSRFKQIPDYVFWLKNINGASFYQRGITSASFRVHDKSQTYSRPSYDKADESVLLLNLISMGEIRLPIDIDYKAFATSAFVFSACLHIRSGRFNIALQRLLSSINISMVHTIAFSNVKRVASNIYYVLFKSK